MNQQLVPSNCSPPAGQAIENLQRDVQRRFNGRLRDFHLSWRDGGLVLNGRADCYYTKQLAQHAVIDSSHLPIRANEIEVI
jgi:hypothetical protein